MSYKIYKLINGKEEDKAKAKGRAFVSKLKCPPDLKNHCENGEDGNPYVTYKNKKILFEQSEKLSYSHAGSF